MGGPETNTEALPTPIWGFGPPSPEPDTKKLDALLASLNGSAERFQTLWFSFLGLTLYLAIAALATTHRDLLLNNPQTLPILNIKVELLPFYIIAPLLYLVFHFYLLMMLALLARTAAEFDKQLRTTLPAKPEQERYRALVGNALFLQLLVGMKSERTGVNAFLMGLIALITIVLAPLATLVLMQMMFLPYHHLRITWWHRGIVVADLVLIVVMTYRCFFPRGVRKAPVVLGALSRKPRWAAAMAFCVLLAIVLAPLVDWLSFRQGRWAGEPWSSPFEEREITDKRPLPRPPSFEERQGPMAGEPPELPAPPSSSEDREGGMAGERPELPEVNPDYAATENGVVFSLFPDRLELPSKTIVGEKTLEETKKEIASRGGDFVPTIELDKRDLQAADLSGADLRGVSLNSAQLQGAYLLEAQLKGARLNSAQLQGADLGGAQLQGAYLLEAQLKGARLNSAQLQGADLGGAQLQGANLLSAQLQGANLLSAQLQGANLRDAQLQGANLWGAKLQGADLEGAKLQGARLASAQLQGADLGGAQLQGADLHAAHLQGTSLTEAQLQGAHLGRADLKDSELYGTFVFRAAVADRDLSPAAIRSVHAGQVKAAQLGGDAPRLSTTPGNLTDADVKAWIDATTQFAADDDKENIRQRFETLNPGFQTRVEDEVDEAKWREVTKQSVASDPDGAQHRERLAAFFADLVCGADGGPYIARGLIRQKNEDGVARMAALGDQLERVRNRMKAGRDKPDECKGVAAFTEDDWRGLEAIKPIEPAPSDR